MKPRVLFPILIGMFVALACACPAFSLPKKTPTPAPATATPLPLLETPTASSLPAIRSDAAPFNIDWGDRSLFKQRLTRAYQPVLGKLSGASMYHLAFSFSDPPGQVNGLEEVRYTNQESADLTEVDLPFTRKSWAAASRSGRCVWMEPV
jgi:hypothetical protein